MPERPGAPRHSDAHLPHLLTTGRGNERVNGSLGLLDMTPYGRGEAWEGYPEGWPEGRDACRSWRSDADGNAGQPRGPRRVLVLALGRRRERHLWPDQQSRTAVDPSWCDRCENPGAGEAVTTEEARVTNPAGRSS
ncbi:MULTISPECIES: hypothetical protein [Streptomyces]|uniref:hypothetical protein n=1 Tax=Streptomyces TaxID=1883 RepID=UPI003B8A9102